MSLQRGSLVLARSFEDQPLVRRLWAADPKEIYVCEYDQYEKLAKHLPARAPVGVPSGDAFAFDEELIAALQDAHHKRDRKRLMRLWVEAKPLTIGADLDYFDHG